MVSTDLLSTAFHTHSWSGANDLNADRIESSHGIGASEQAIQVSFQTQDGYIEVPNTPGLGIESLNDAVIKEHLDPDEQEPWQPTDEWNEEHTHDRLWS